MDLRPDMMGHQPHDAFGIGWRDPVARITQPLGQAVDPQPPIGVEHDLDHSRVRQMRRNGRSHRRA